MKVIIAGGREITDYKTVSDGIIEALREWGRPAVTEVVSGKARGVDTLGERWANNHGIRVKPFPADWGQYGKVAGFMRNQQMADYADALIAIWDGQSRGTKDMIDRAKAGGLLVYVYETTRQ